MQSKSQFRYRLRVLLGAVLASAGTPSFALNPNQQVSQYGHNVWRMQDGVFPGTPRSITQTRDGYLWIGTQAGLARFDGARFVMWAPPGGKRMGGAVLSLLGARDGSLWIGTTGGIAHQEGDAYGTWQLGRINAIVEDTSGSVWVARSRISDHNGPLCRVAPGEVRCFGEEEGIPFRREGAEALIDDHNGGLWIGSVKSLRHWEAGAVTVYPLRSLTRAEGSAGIQALALDQDGAPLVGTGQNGAGAGLLKLSSKMWSEYTPGSFRGSSLSVAAILRDHDGALWIGTVNSGLVHIHNGETDVFTEADGLSGNSIENLYEDREANIWVVSSRGLDRFRELPVVTIGKREGLSGEHVTSVFAARERVWLGNRTSVDFIRNGRVLSLSPGVLPGKTTTSILEDHLGQLWLGMDAGLNVMTAGRFRPIHTRDGKPLGVVFALAEGIGNHVYAAVTGRPQRIYDLRNCEVVAVADIPMVVPSSAFEADPGGGVWLLSDDETLMHYESGKFEVVGPRGTCCARTLFHDERNVLWAAGSKGVGRWTGANWQTLTARNGLSCERIRSAIFDDHGTLWLTGDCGLMSIDPSNLRIWIAQPDARISVHTYDVVDGAQTGNSPFQPTVSKSPDGRLWFANENVLQVVDPTHRVENRVPPQVLIEAVVADGRDYRPGSALHLPARTRTLRIDYTALSLVAPQKVRFRYMLAGGNEGWQDAEARRQAFYNVSVRPSSSFHPPARLMEW
jgi:ligand-binding sensor domain-containing protein